MQLIKIRLLLVLLLHAWIASGQGENALLQANMKIYCSTKITYGKEIAVMVTLAKYPRYPIVLHLSTLKYLLMYQEVGIGSAPMTPTFRNSDRISDELQRHNIVQEGPLAYESGFYVVIMATFWEMGYTKLTLEGSAPSKRGIEPVNENIQLDVKAPPYCVPLIVTRLCSNPNNPLPVSVRRTIILSAHVLKSCDMDSPILTWTIMDLMGITVLKTYTDQRKLFPLKRYEIRFTTKFEMWRNLYMIRVDGEFNGLKYATRCYLKVHPEYLQAVISGGVEKHLQYMSDVVMDGTDSRDYSKQRREKQFRTYNWKCFPQDGIPNSVCQHGVISNAPKFTIPGYYFVLHSTYVFMLTLTADDDPNKTSYAFQTLTIVSYGTLNIDMQCLSNCALGQYNENKKVLLLAKCFDCHTLHDISYSWYVMDALTLNTKTLSTHIHTAKSVATIRLDVRSTDGRIGSELMTLRQNVPPKYGKCSIKPIEGVEAQTQFSMCCEQFKTHNAPLVYLFYARRMLLTECHNCACTIHLPKDVRCVKVFICDHSLTCSKKYVPVTVIPLANLTLSTPEEIWEYLTTAPHNVLQLATTGHMKRLLAYIQFVATHIDSPEKGSVLMRALEDAHPYTLASLGKLATLTKTLAVQLTPIGARGQQVLVRSLSKLNEVFASIYENEMQRSLVEEPYMNVTMSCVMVYDMMRSLSKQLPRPPQEIYDNYNDAVTFENLDQNLVDLLLQRIYKYKNKDCKQRSLNWLNSMWQTERLYRFLYMARKHGIQPDEPSGLDVGVALDIRCFKVEYGRTYVTKTRDRMHTVYTRPELLHEVMEPYTGSVCIKVVSTIRELGWWYPEDKQPSAVLLSVHLYFQEDKFKHEIHLSDSKMSFNTVVSKYRPAQDYPEVSMNAHSQGRIWFDDDDEDTEDSVGETGKYVNFQKHEQLQMMQEVRVYRTNLDDHSMMVVRFQHTTHRLRALLILDETPLKMSEAIRKEGCVVPADSRNSTLLLRNNCFSWHRVYLAVQVDSEYTHEDYESTPIPGGPALYSFAIQLRSCDYWMYSLGEGKERCLIA
ncbi:GH11067 [Drosophila grimshawi]|uniref:GH11067 n=1 Tax=Drosophila grimshawi TaxID=7222 RepID=B4JCH5_DROGR|nr:GH11067 [Drosophila grimshawi]